MCFLELLPGIQQEMDFLLLDRYESNFKELSWYPRFYFLSILQVKPQNRERPCRFIVPQGIMPLLHIN